MKFFKSGAFKAIIYILIFAGFLKIGGLVFAWLWNSYLIRYFQLEHISFLEAVGMIAFLYLVYTGVKFGFDSILSLNKQPDKMSPGNMPQCRNCERMAEPLPIKYARIMTQDEKDKLKEALAKCCGLPNTTQISSTPQTLNLHITKKELSN
jgi:hypothetical protein